MSTVACRLTAVARCRLIRGAVAISDLRLELLYAVTLSLPKRAFREETWYALDQNSFKLLHHRSVSEVLKMLVRSVSMLVLDTDGYEARSRYEALYCQLVSPSSQNNRHRGVELGGRDQTRRHRQLSRAHNLCDDSGENSGRLGPVLPASNMLLYIVITAVTAQASLVRQEARDKQVPA